MRWIVGAVLLLGPACASTRTVGMTELELVASETKPVVCLDEGTGSTGELEFGTVAGRPAVRAAIAAFSSYTLDQRVEIPGGTAYGGESCINDMICIRLVVVQLGEQTFVASDFSISQGPVPAAASSQAIVERATREGVLDKLAALQLDAPTRIAFAALADARESAVWIKVAGIAGSAAAMTAGAYTGDQELMRSGRDAGLNIASLQLTDAERPLIAQFPGLIPVLRFGRTVCIEGKPPS